MSDRHYSHDTYLSPYTWRYGSPEMRRIWSELNRRRLWRRVWVALAQAEQAVGLVTAEQGADLQAHSEDIDLERALAIEAEIHHDLMAEVRTYAEQCRVGGGIIHLGATSMDIEDNAEALRIRDALALLLHRLARLLEIFADQIERWADASTMAFTHLQPAEPTTVGYRLAQYGQDLLTDYLDLRRVAAGIRGKGLKGAVGTSASYAAIAPRHRHDPRRVGGPGHGLPRPRSLPCRNPDLSPQTGLHGPRQSGRAGRSLSTSSRSICASCKRRPSASGPSRSAVGQVGSSAMPFKRNPIHAENVDSLARLLASMPRIAWDNAAHSLLERTLDDSANRRTILPEAFLIADELITRCTRIIEGLRVDRMASERLLTAYGPFAATERLLMELARRGADRQSMHEVIREHAMAAWAAVQQGAPNPLINSLAADPRLTAYAGREQLVAWLDASEYIGDAPERARALVTMIRERDIPLQGKPPDVNL